MNLSKESTPTMASQRNQVADLIADLQRSGFYGQLLLEIKNGYVTYVKKTQSIKLRGGDDRESA
jgi:hypothetical protein